MDKQNVTLSLPKDLLKKVKILAVNKEKSMSDLLRETLENIVNDETGYQAARDRQIALMKKGLSLGVEGKIKFTREDLHERR